MGTVPNGPRWGLSPTGPRGWSFGDSPGGDGSGGETDRRVHEGRAAPVKAPQRDRALATTDLDDHAPGLLVSAQLGARMAPAQEGDLARLLLGKLVLHDITSAADLNG